MIPPTTCPKCQGRMAEGFLLDQTYGSQALTHWYEGQPRKSIWTGIRTRGLTRHAVKTWRCGRCGFLESYAPGA